MIDLSQFKYDLLDYGSLELIDKMGTDRSIEQAARVSYAGDAYVREEKDTRKLLTYLWRNQHSSPFEHVTVSMHVKCPIFVARQWMRHRTWSYNEISARYTELPDEWFTPAEWRGQSKDNKQMSDGLVDYEPMLVYCEGKMMCAEEIAFTEYRRRLAAGVSRELARTVLPLGTYTRFYATVDLLNLLKFIKLRDHEHAQYEIQVFAGAITDALRELVPITASIALPEDTHEVST